MKIKVDDGLERIIDLSDILHSPIYGPLQVPQFFAQLRIDPEIHTVVWPNGADFDQETLYNWPDYAEAMKTMVRRWAKTQRQAA